MKKKVLIIEDESAIADTITYSLSTEGIDSLWVDTGHHGIEKIKTDSIDLIILDVGLPDISGFDLIKEIRRESDIPVLFLTARAEEIDRVLGLELGADDYVVKPFSPRELSARVKAILRRSNPVISPKPQNNTFEIDRNRRHIKYFGERLPLSRYEYDIMCLLLDKPGWVFSRDAIMESVWSEPDESFDRTVDAHIKAIRAKLKAINPDLDPIETHRGVGYAVREKI